MVRNERRVGKGEDETKEERDMTIPAQNLRN
jgi:hypothetical protein